MDLTRHLTPREISHLKALRRSGRGPEVEFRRLELQYILACPACPPSGINLALSETAEIAPLSDTEIAVIHAAQYNEAEHNLQTLLARRATLYRRRDVNARGIQEHTRYTSQIHELTDHIRRAEEELLILEEHLALLA
ncbi:hypothetical protein DFH09DRAFT_1092836 [Mycena vulgaris]|nr:hypothetical protein DFH09DRAFT_1092836 [Mycena vulgaris]